MSTISYLIPRKLRTFSLVKRSLSNTVTPSIKQPYTTLLANNSVLDDSSSDVMHRRTSFFTAQRQLLLEIFPEAHRHLWLYMHVPYGFWNDRSNRSDFFDWLGKQLKIEHPGDWRRVTVVEFGRYGGHGILRYYHGSLRRALRDIYGRSNQHHLGRSTYDDWRPWRFVHKKTSIERTRQELLEYLSKYLNIVQCEDWYHVCLSEISELIGESGHRWLGSMKILQRALLQRYPNYTWKPWLFGRVNKGFWELEVNRRQFLQWFAEHWEIYTNTEWQYVAREQFLSTKGGSSLLAHFGGLHSLLSYVCRDQTWNQFVLCDQPRSSSPVISDRKERISFSKSQWNLYRKLQCLFPDEVILLNYRDPSLFRTGRQELDIYLPDQALALEYHGPQHYHWHFRCRSSWIIQQRLDGEKLQLCNRHGITMVEIPYWWDGTENSLMSIIHALRPELFSQISTMSQSISKSVICPSAKGVVLKAYLKSGLSWSQNT